MENLNKTREGIVLKLTVEPFLTQLARWPQVGRYIPAQFNKQSIIIHHAHGPKNLAPELMPGPPARDRTTPGPRTRWKFIIVNRNSLYYT